MKKILSTTTTVILTIILACMIFIVISSKASGGEPELFGYQLKMVLSGSMEPTFKTGSIIAIEPETGDGKDYKVNDVITYRVDNETIVTHRIEEVVESGKEHVMYVTKGDNNNSQDREPILAENIIGKYTGFTIPYLGYVMDYANTALGSGLLLIIPGLILIGYSVFFIRRGLIELENYNKDQSAGL